MNIRSHSNKSGTGFHNYSSHRHHQQLYDVLPTHRVIQRRVSLLIAHVSSDLNAHGLSVYIRIVHLTCPMPD